MTSIETNPRGIPKAPFVNKVETFLEKSGDVESTLKKFDETLAYVLPLLSTSKSFNKH
jgi:hypothetical protein